MNASDKTPGIKQISLTLVSDEHGYSDYDIGKGSQLHRICVPHSVAQNEAINGYGPGSSKRSVEWKASLDKLLRPYIDGEDELSFKMILGDIEIDPAQIILPGYYSDGPGYVGDLWFAVHGRHLLVSREHYVKNRPKGKTTLPLKTDVLFLPDSLPGLTAVHNYDPAMHAQHVQNILSDEVNEDFMICGNWEIGLPDSRIKMLDFDSGEKGFILVFGEPCYFSLACGRRIYDFQCDSHDPTVIATEKSDSINQ